LRLLKKHIVCLLGLLSISSPQLIAQHCGYDGAYIIVLNIHNSENTDNISDLRISVMDSFGSTITKNFWNREKQQRDTLFFWRNPDNTSVKGKTEQRHSMYPRPNRFWFADDHYVMVLNGNEEYTQIRIQDPKGRYDELIIPIYSEEVYPLCSGYSRWQRGEKWGFIEGYKAKDVTLTLVGL